LDDEILQKERKFDISQTSQQKLFANISTV